jgi:hypothetical protein
VVIPAHEHRRSGEGNRVTSPISVTSTAATIGPTPFKRLDGVVAAVVGQRGGDGAVELGDVVVVGADQRPQRRQARGVAIGQLEGVERGGATGPNMSVRVGSTPCLPITAWTCALSPARRRTSLWR